MANKRYTKYIAALLDGTAGPHWTADTIKAVLVRTSSYGVDIDNDQYLTAVPSGARVATVTLTGVTRTLGVITATNPTFGVVAAGAACQAIVIYKDTGSAATSPLLMYLDTFASGMPVTPDGVNPINVVIDASGLLTM